MILEVKNLSFGYKKDHPLFHNVNFSLDKGEIFSILGANGAGKSTLMNCIANLLIPQQGDIYLSGKKLTNLSIKEISQTVGYVPQTNSPVYGYEVREFIVMGRAPYLGMFEKPSKKDYDLVDEVLEELDISHLADRSYTELSGGERQQVSIARAIVQQPDIIMLDEPANHLDYGNQLKIIQLIKKLSKKGYSIIITSHIPDHVLLLGGKVGLLNQNGTLLTGANEEIMTEENLKSLYHVEVHLVYLQELKRKVCVAGENI
ncbi:MAG: ABC transporter ATP-binding protein [Lachnospiraceae bacterium]|nr:ABC transporter ATP-binding protein [Lachnospiraceae bacterium]